jgi:hypothetical protein
MPTNRPRPSRYPAHMLILKQTLSEATMSFNRQGELVHQAIYTRKRGREPMEQFIVSVREGTAMFFHMVWDQELREGVGDWTAINALAVHDLDELFESASQEVRELLDDHRWEPI